MIHLTLYKSLCVLNAFVWVINGLICKVLDLVPRHRHIVARILGATYANLLTKAIGILEIGMAVWIISGIASHLNAIAQIVIVGFMNVIEFVYAPDLLLWGRLNALFALLFMLLIYMNEFILR